MQPPKILPTMSLYRYPSIDSILYESICERLANLLVGVQITNVNHLFLYNLCCYQ